LQDLLTLIKGACKPDLNVFSCGQGISWYESMGHSRGVCCGPGMN